MLIELRMVTLNVRKGSTDAMSHEPHECPYCHVMTCFFVNRDGRTTCTACDLEPTR